MGNAYANGQGVTRDREMGRLKGVRSKVAPCRQDYERQHNSGKQAPDHLAIAAADASACNGAVSEAVVVRESITFLAAAVDIDHS